jgi:glycosyltransferase involved in cell wall biosynthesis
MGRKSLDDLRLLYGAAFALMYVSFFEGFGIPILEAFQAGIPVLTSNTSSMPEITGGAALLVSPDSVEEIFEAMVKLSCDEALRIDLIKRGSERMSYFSWDKTADALWASIEKAVK